MLGRTIFATSRDLALPCSGPHQPDGGDGRQNGARGDRWVQGVSSACCFAPVFNKVERSQPVEPTSSPVYSQRPIPLGGVALLLAPGTPQNRTTWHSLPSLPAASGWPPVSGFSTIGSLSVGATPSRWGFRERVDGCRGKSTPRSILS